VVMMLRLEDRLLACVLSVVNALSRSSMAPPVPLILLTSAQFPRLRRCPDLKWTSWRRSR